MPPGELEEAVSSAFAYLTESFGFKRLSATAHGREFWSTFHNETTAVTVHYEIGGPVWVELARLETYSGKRVERDRCALEFLLQERAPQEPSLPWRTDEDLCFMIREKARQLREYGSDILNGDFRIVPRLKELAAENLRRRNATEGRR